LAVAVAGYNDGSDNEYNLHNGSVSIYCAANGSLVARLGTNDEFMSAAWDNVGNVYATHLTDVAASAPPSVWRVYSPPGANHAATTAVPVIQVYDPLAPPLLGIPAAPAAPGDPFGFTLLGQSNVTYIIQSSPDLLTWTSIATNYDIVPLRAITVPGTNDAVFFQAVAPQ
jgi:hypothetical protein